jgi:hypothetical protein
VSNGELDRLFEPFFALVEATVRLPPGRDRRSAFRDIGDYGSRSDQIVTRLLNWLKRQVPASSPTARLAGKKYS